MVLGVAGVVTDGRLRDTPEIETLDFPVGCAGRAAPTSLVRHHAMDINVPIGCSEVAIYSGDIIVGDGNGVAVILRHLADDAALGYEQALLEDFVAERSNLNSYPPNAEMLEEFRKRKLDRGSA